MQAPLYEFAKFNDDGDPLWPDIRFELMWHSHGGSGLGLSFVDCEDLDFLEAYDLYNRVMARRREEADAIREAAKPKSAR